MIQLPVQLKKIQLHEGMLHVKSVRATCNNIFWRDKLRGKIVTLNITLGLMKSHFYVN